MNDSEAVELPWNQIQTDARALCAGDCPLGPTITSLSTGGDGQSFLNIKTCTGICAHRTAALLEGADPNQKVERFEKTRRNIGEPTVIVDSYHPEVRA